MHSYIRDRNTLLEPLEALIWLKNIAARVVVTSLVVAQLLLLHCSSHKENLPAADVATPASAFVSLRVRNRHAGGIHGFVTKMQRYCGLMREHGFSEI